MSMIEQYLFALRMAKEAGKALGEKLAELLRPVVDLTFALGWEKGNPSVISFFARDRGVFQDKGSILLESVITEVFPELVFHIDSPFGIFLDDDEAQKAKEILEAWKVRENKKMEEAIKWAKDEIKEVE